MAPRATENSGALPHQIGGPLWPSTQRPGIRERPEEDLTAHCIHARRSKER